MRRVAYGTVAFKETTEKAANFMAADKFLGLFGRKIGTLATVTSPQIN
jgi:hypothetical protein